MLQVNFGTCGVWPHTDPANRVKGRRDSFLTSLTIRGFKNWNLLLDRVNELVCPLRNKNSKKLSTKFLFVLFIATRCVH